MDFYEITFSYSSSSCWYVLLPTNSRNGSRVTNDEIINRVKEKNFLRHVIKRNSRYFGQWIRHPSLETDIMVNTTQGSRRKGIPRRSNLSATAVKKARDEPTRIDHLPMTSY